MTFDTYRKLSFILISVVIFLAPTNLFLNLTEQYAFLTGLRVDYLIPKLYIVDIAMLAVIGLHLFLNRPAITVKKAFEHKWIWILLLLIFVQQLLTPIPVVGLWTLFQWLLILGCFYIAHKTKFFNTPYFYTSLVATILFQSSIGIGQFLLQRSIVSYYFLGETSLSDFAGIAKTTFFGAEKILAYGTTAHPNVLGGYLAIYMLLVLVSGSVSVSVLVSDSVHKSIKVLVLVLGTICLLLTGSLSAIATFFIALSYLFLKKQRPRQTLKLSQLRKTIAYCLLPIAFVVIPILIQLTTRFIDNSSLERRAVLNEAATQLIIANPLGIGLGQFVTGVENFTQTNEIVRFLQPVHHVPLLIVSELGLVTLLLVFGLLYKYRQLNIHLLPIAYCLLPILALDHYLWSLEPGRVLFMLSLSIFTSVVYYKK